MAEDTKKNLTYQKKQPTISKQKYRNSRGHPVLLGVGALAVQTSELVDQFVTNAFLMNSRESRKL